MAHTKIERLRASLSGNKPDRTPVALWRHFPVDDQQPESLAAATIDFQRQYDFDFVKVTPASSFCLRDWGVTDIWRGSAEGTREYSKSVINNPEGWLKLRPLDPYVGVLGEQLACLRLINQELGKGPDPAPVIQTIFSPLAQAKNMVGKDALVTHIRLYPEAVLEGLKVIVESTRRFIEAARETGIAGIFYALQHASYAILSEAEFHEFSELFDLDILQESKSLWLNVLHLHGEDVMFQQVANYPVQVINWHDRDTAPDLREARKSFKGALCGGLQRERIITGNPVSITAEARDAIQLAGETRFILGTGCVMEITAPRANILAARQAVNT